MAVSAVQDINVQNALIGSYGLSKVTTDSGAAFDNLLSSAINMYKEADDLQKAAEESEINFALGYSNNIHDLADIQFKATTALQYTVKVTNKALEAYKELMNMQV